jgi:hypothetical protein
VLSTASNRGEVDHCGCARERKGGLPWRACLIDSLRAGGDLLLVDAGDVVHRDAHGNGARDRFVLEAMGDMGYAAMTLGETRVVVDPDGALTAFTGRAMPILIDAVCADPALVGALHELRARPGDGAVETGHATRHAGD